MAGVITTYEDGTNTRLGVDETGNDLVPTEALHIEGSIRVVDGSEAVGTSLVDDGTGTGVATWGSPASIGALTYGGISVTTSPTHTANTVNVVAGAIIAGSVVSTRTIDGVYLQVDESAAFDIQFSFTGLTGNPARCEFRGRYEGNPAHNVKLYQWNFTGGVWDAVTAAGNDFASSATDYTLRFELTSTSDYIQAGEARLRIFHTSANNPNHDIYIDYIDITEETLDMTTAGTFYQITGLADGVNNNVTVNGAAGTITIVDSGDYILTQTTSFIGLPDTIIQCHLFIDGVDDVELWHRQLGASGDVGSAAATIIKTLTAAEVLSWRFSADMPDAYISTLTSSMTLLKVG